MDREESRKQDAEIVKRVLKGDKNAFGELVKKYQSKLGGVVYNYLGPYEDLDGAVQETFLRAYRQLHTLTDPRQFGSWLVKIARNLCIDTLRKRKEDLQSLEHVEEKGLQVESGEIQPVTQLIEEEDMEKFQEAFDSLDPVYRELLTLKNFCKLTYDEISDVTGYNKAKIGELLFKARKALRKKLEEMSKKEK
ncbi:MAG: sigma-70 family RNA polymerase sigma factor [Planctomycetota bacterium]|nr:MAG: sigma-70 family RNA polymerase sigma factor [Planctomycetota bacterium]